MLPDFPSIKRVILRGLGDFVNRRVGQDPILRTIPRYTMHEGDRTTLTRSDGTEATIDFKEPLQAIAKVSMADIRTKGSTATLLAAEAIATDLARGLAQRVYEGIRQTTDEIGNTVDAAGERFSPHLYLQVLRKLQLQFDREGNWLQPQFAAAPDNLKTIEIVLRQAEQDPEFVAARDAIVNQQREDWRAREANRKLVD
jgi:hypothetical protein